MLLIAAVNVNEVWSELKTSLLVPDAYSTIGHPWYPELLPARTPDGTTPHINLCMPVSERRGKSVVKSKPFGLPATTVVEANIIGALED